MGHEHIVCACEEVSRGELDEAVRSGMNDIESVKRYTGLGTGLCQGRSCLVNAALHLQKTAAPSAPLAPFTARPPLRPLRLDQLASLPTPGPDQPSPDGVEGLPPHEIQVPIFGTEEPLPARASVVIIGGGIMGVALAYELSRQGERDVVVIERDYLLAGASGRNGGGVRAQWSTPTLIELGKHSLEICADFASDMGINVWFRRGGYLFLARQPQTARQMEHAVRLHEKHGLRTRLVTPAEAASIVPGLVTHGVQAATWNPDDGVVFPWPFVWGYARKAREAGVRIHTHTAVLDLPVLDGRIQGVHTSRGFIAADRVVLAAGAWSPQLARLAGVHLPNVPYRHEICTCEPLKPFVDPLVSELDGGLYFSQSARGELVGGMGDKLEPPGLHQHGSLRFLVRYAQGVLRLMPHLGALKVVRQWAGCYDVTPDRSPILGETPGVAGLLQMSGFVGHGFMMAPAVARRMAAWMGGSPDELFERFSVARFAEGRLEPESMIIG